VLTVLALPLAVWGSVQVLRGARRWFQSLPLWIVAYVALLAPFAHEPWRMRLAAEPLVTLIAAAGLMDAWRRLRFRPDRSR
jgi:hypothetical protein